jgi:Fe-Mn family superoxide dismutase
MKFELPKLGYEYSDLEPVIDALTMEIHHSKHHAGYVNNLNIALETYEGESTLEGMMGAISTFPNSIQTAVRNNGGGHFNHSMYWEVMTPGGSKNPGGDLSGLIEAAFGSFDGFKEKFLAAGMGRFGSGWAWLGVDKDKKLVICSTPNQDNPLMKGLVDCGCQPILGIDVWEHAYYLKHQNKRVDYISSWFELVNWDKVGDKYEQVVK